MPINCGNLYATVYTIAHKLPLNTGMGLSRWFGFQTELACKKAGIDTIAHLTKATTELVYQSNQKGTA